MTVLAGRLRDDEKYVGWELAVMKEESGFPVLLGANAEVVALNVRRARGAAFRESRVGREERIKPEAVEATRRVRDAIVLCVCVRVVVPDRASSFQLGKLAVIGGRPPAAAVLHKRVFNMLTCFELILSLDFPYTYP